MTMPRLTTAPPQAQGCLGSARPQIRASAPDLVRRGQGRRVGQGGGAAGRCAAGLSAPSGTAPFAGPAAPLAGPPARLADGGIPGVTLFAGKVPFAGSTPGA